MIIKCSFCGCDIDSLECAFCLNSNDLGRYENDDEGAIPSSPPQPVQENKL